MKTEERCLFGDSFIVPTHFDFEGLSEYKHILSKLFFRMRNNNRSFLFSWKSSSGLINVVIYIYMCVCVCVCVCVRFTIFVNTLINISICQYLSMYLSIYLFIPVCQYLSVKNLYFNRIPYPNVNKNKFPFYCLMINLLFRHFLNSLYKYVRTIIMFAISIFSSSKITPAGVESTLEKYGVFFIHSIQISNNLKT